MITVPSGLFVFGFIMILGFIGNYIFNRTQIPSIVWLLLFGLIVGLAFNIQGDISQTSLSTISNFFASIAIVIILFDGGINTDIYQLFRGAPRGLLLTVSGFCLSLLATMGIVVGLAFFNFLAISMENSVIVGLLLGAIVGGTSSPIVIPLVCRLKNLQEKTKMILTIESIITDPLSIVVFLAASYMVLSGNIDIAIGLKNLVGTFSIGAVVGVVSGLIWLPVMHKIRKEQFSYVATLAFVFLVFSLTVNLVGENEGGTGAGAISCLMFGLILGNGKKILKMINYTGRRYEMDEENKQYHSLISFLMRTFFFVYLGIMVRFQKIEYIVIGILVLILLLLMRYLAVIISTVKGGFEKDDKQTMAVTMPRGLAAAILAINFGPRLADELIPSLKGFFTDVTFVVILGTAIVCTIGVSIISHYEMKKLKNPDRQRIENLIDIKQK